MTDDLQLRLAQNKADWLALSLCISSSEQAAFAGRHDEYFASYGPNFMAHVYRSAIEQVLRNIPEAERSKLLEAFETAMRSAIESCAYIHPTAANCSACHARTP